jgi:hypothetical protein
MLTNVTYLRPVVNSMPYIFFLANKRRIGYSGLMRRIWFVLSFVALLATALTAATTGPVTADDRTEVAQATAPARTAGLAGPLGHRRSDARIGFRPELRLLFTDFEGLVPSSPHAGQDRTYRVVLLDGSDRWRSLLLGAPPLFA